MLWNPPSYRSTSPRSSLLHSQLQNSPSCTGPMAMWRLPPRAFLDVWTTGLLLSGMSLHLLPYLQPFCQNNCVSFCPSRFLTLPLLPLLLSLFELLDLLTDSTGDSDCLVAPLLVGLVLFSACGFLVEAPITVANG